MKRIRSKLVNFISGGRADREMAREMEAHLALMRDEFERRGMAPDQARRAALIAFGGMEQTRELHREARSFVWIEQTWQDIRYAARGLARTPSFTAMAVLTLALGIGVNTALFTTYNAVALKPLPVSDPDRVLRFERWFESRATGTGQYAFSWPEFNYCRDHAKAFTRLVAASWLFPAIGTSGRQKMTGQLVSANYFSDLGIPMRHGHGFVQDAPDPVIVISYRFWSRSLGSDPAAVGRTLTLNGVPVTVVGITQERFTGTSVNPEIPDFWAPLAMQRVLMPDQDWLNQPTVRQLQIFARLKPAMPVAEARAEAELLIRQFGTTYAETDRTRAVTLQRTSYFPNTDDIRFRALAAGAMLIVGLVLFVACVNVGNMLLARGAARQGEIAARVALGAGRGRIIRQLLTESLLLSGAGGAAGLAASVWATRLASTALAANADLIGGDIHAVDLSPDLSVLMYVLAISICSGILFGLSPALRLARRDILSALKDDRGAGAKTSGSSGMRGFLVGAQVAASVLLLGTAGLLARGMLRARVAEPGFDTRGIFVVSGNFGGLDDKPATIDAHRKALAERLRRRPEVAAVALGGVPFGGTWTPPIRVDGVAGETMAGYASETYAGLIGIPLVRGRNFLPAEVAVNAPVALISEATARRFWHNRDPLGKQFTLDMNWKGMFRSFEVIGVVADVRFGNLTRKDPAHVYLAGTGGNPGILLRLRGARPQAEAALLATMESADRSLIDDPRLINLDEGFVSGMRSLSRSLAGFATVLAVLAMALAGIGIYGVVGYLVGRRTKEIGIRIALGATGAGVLRNVVLQSLKPVSTGILCGIAMAAGLSALLHQTLIFPGSMDLFYGVPFYDPVTFAALFCFVALLTTAASLAPARRALRVDPTIALRYE